MLFPHVAMAWLLIDPEWWPGVNYKWRQSRVPDLGNKGLHGTYSYWKKVFLFIWHANLTQSPALHRATLGHGDRIHSIPGSAARASSLACALLWLGPRREVEKLKNQTEVEWPVLEHLEMTGNLAKQKWRPWLMLLKKNTIKKKYKLVFKFLSHVFQGSRKRKQYASQG